MVERGAAAEDRHHACHPHNLSSFSRCVYPSSVTMLLHRHHHHPSSSSWQEDARTSRGGGTVILQCTNVPSAITITAAILHEGWIHIACCHWRSTTVHDRRRRYIAINLSGDNIWIIHRRRAITSIAIMQEPHIPPHFLDCIIVLFCTVSHDEE